ncbi:hypothetical protein Riv7116_6492 [Rivularia sp. PCC 7116]|uniref:hypothetical protein n=1 Tax=Rivularia sp. PCC 7116 TaxID=373994 RepID=UPI00029F2147|nr:hypothetical protein [Rivularia sp. PCC 7116]AFY58821.1 hypothetical protein Riv7116_6492 [Rivularia sp. PCC 7116]
MLNFHQLQPIVDEKYSFIGIQKQDNKLYLYLPKGFDTKNYDKYDSKRDTYFLFYRVLHRYKQICAKKGNLEKQLAKDRDGVIQTNGSVHKVVIPDNNDEEVLLYSKLDAISKILDAYEEPKILSLAYRLGESEEIDYSQIHQYLDRAKYLPNGAAYIDTMDMPRLQVKYQSTDIIGMYCYIFVEVKQQLGEEITSEIQALSEEFAHRYLDTESSVFNEEYCIQTVDILKDILETIEHRTPIKDADYWDFHNAIELFLYGELSQQDEGEIWGINNFCFVWESMCLTYLTKNISLSRLLYIDKSYLEVDLPKSVDSEPKLLNEENVFRINGKNLRPDAIIKSNIFDITSSLQQKAPLFADGLRLETDNWDDYGYRTTFSGNLLNKDDSVFEYTELKIIYIGQPYNEIHTSQELNRICTPLQWQRSKNEQYLIKSRLPIKFYSYWDIDLNTINIRQLACMYLLNHIFYIGIENKVYCKDKFYIFLKNTFSLKEQENILLCSLFRRLGDVYDDENSLHLMFEEFVKAITCLNIIDIKYKPTDYYFNKSNIEEIKSRDIRKQFVYEYLLQQHLKNNNKFNKLPIKSSFWLPTDDESKHMTKVEPEYLNDYIELNKVSFNIIAKSYLE